MWIIPMVYVGAAVTAGLFLPRLEQAYLASDTLLLSVGSAQAYLFAAASGMMALTGIVFAMGFVMVQFSAIAYSPRLVLWFARDPILFHALGVFGATFIYALFTLAWVDRGGGDQGRAVISELFPPIAESATRADAAAGTELDGHAFGPIMQELRYTGPPRTIARVEAIRHDEILRTIELRRERTFEQDPKYPIRLLVDVAIKALSPAINDPTTAVQTINQIEDLLRRLGCSQLSAGVVRDADGIVRLILPMPSWDDYLTLAFDEIRLYGVTSVQVMRRMRSALVSLANSPLPPARIEMLRNYLIHLDSVIAASPLDLKDRTMASQEDRQGIGMFAVRDSLLKPVRIGPA
jgi:uncharacterized membrane protein